MSQKRLFLLFISALLLFQACNPDEIIIPPHVPDQNHFSEKETYFLEIAFGNEFGNPYTHVRRWDTPIRIFNSDTNYPVLNQELVRIAAELNTLISDTSVRVSFVPTRAQSNLVVYFGNAGTYVSRYQSSAAPFISTNWGLFFLQWNSDYTIESGTVFVDTERNSENIFRLHLLREELTQSLGLMNDTYDYENSIFFQGWTSVQAYAEIDSQLIRLMYSDSIQPGMSRAEVEDLLGKN